MNRRRTHLRFAPMGLLMLATLPTWPQAAWARPVGLGSVSRLSRPDIPAANFSTAAVAIDDGRAVLCPALRFGGSGSCLIFQRASADPGSWSFVKEVLNPQPVAWDEFGSATDLRGETAIVGLPGSDAGGLNAGAMSMHERNMGGTDSWGVARTLYAPDALPEHVFSWDVAISGDTVVVGAPTINMADFGFGSAYVFERNQGGIDAWGLVKTLSASDSPIFANFGFSVAILEDRIVAGAPGVESDAGAAYVFERDFGGADNWGEVAKLTASDGLSGDRFGSSVALGPDTLAVGAPRRDEAGLNTGAVYLFASVPWLEQQKFIGSVQDGLGTALAFGDGLLAAGAPGNLGPELRAGTVALFAKPSASSNWSWVMSLHAPGASELDGFGTSVDMDANELIVGAPIQGAAYVFDIVGSVPQVPALGAIGLTIMGVLVAGWGMLRVRRRTSERSRHGA